jgi:hypothetical protein
MRAAVPSASEWFPAECRLSNVTASHRCELDIVARARTERLQLESFIAERYASIHGARIRHFAEHLVGFRDERGDWVAALGYTHAARVRLFAEQYLDAPIEEAISARVGTRVDREQIVEVGNLAASNAGAARRVILTMTELLNELACTWVVFTSTRLLLNSFARLSIDTIVLAKADPSRLPDGGKSWGRYYETDPRVMTANIPLHFTRLYPRGAGVAATARQ